MDPALHIKNKQTKNQPAFRYHIDYIAQISFVSLYFDIIIYRNMLDVEPYYYKLLF